MGELMLAAVWTVGDSVHELWGHSWGELAVVCPPAYLNGNFLSRRHSIRFISCSQDPYTVSVQHVFTPYHLSHDHQPIHFQSDPLQSRPKSLTNNQPTNGTEGANAWRRKSRPARSKPNLPHSCRRVRSCFNAFLIPL